MNFKCNLGTIKKAYNRKQLLVFLEENIPVTFLVYKRSRNIPHCDFLILETYYKKRRLVHGKKIVQYCLEKFNEKFFEIECPPIESVEFWENKMGFKIYEAEEKFYGYYIKEKIFAPSEPFKHIQLSNQYEH